MEQVANTEMVQNALDEDYDAAAEPPHIDALMDHRLWPQIRAALMDVYDPEIPVRLYELGLRYKVIMNDHDDGTTDLDITMTLTTPGCPVAGEMPGMVQGAVFPIEGVGEVDVELVWDPQWDPSFMAETAKLQLNMFF